MNEPAISDPPSDWEPVAEGLRSLTATMLGGGGPSWRIGIPFEHFPGWSAQQSFLRATLLPLRNAALSNGGDVMILMLVESADEPVTGLPRNLGAPIFSITRKEWHHTDLRVQALQRLGVQVVLNLFGPPKPTPGIKIIGWIPDFQHLHLPKFFTEAELAQRDESFRGIAEHCDAILLSSQDARSDLIRFAPEAATKARVHPFPSLLVFAEQPTRAPQATVLKYHLQEKFILVANQFWAHKNHDVVIKAVALCRDRGMTVPLVLTGLPLDYRDPLNTPISRVMQSIAEAGLAGIIVPLGLVPSSDLIDLMRCSALIVQPSRFEGWSTSVQDAKTLGRPIVASDLPVHREQVPDALGFFSCDEPEALADILMNVWPSLATGPDASAEHIALTNQLEFARNYGKALWQTCTASI